MDTGLKYRQHLVEIAGDAVDIDAFSSRVRFLLADDERGRGIEWLELVKRRWPGRIVASEATGKALEWDIISEPVFFESRS
jgi:hypothetical protein